MTTDQRRSAVTYLRATYPVSERRACRLARLARSRWQHRSRRPSDAPPAEALERKAEGRPRCRRLAVLLRRDGWRVNLKRALRVYRAEGLRVRRGHRRMKQVSVARVPRPVADGPNAQWAADFIHDQCADGRRFGTLSVVDEYTRECLHLAPDSSWPSAKVAAALDAVASARGALDLADARRLVAAWRDDHDAVRPHSALGNRTPNEFAALLRADPELPSAHPTLSPT